MTDARPTDLNYGHFGEPIYDVDGQKWNFVRNSQDVPQLRSLGGIQNLIPAQLASVDKDSGHNAAQRGQTSKHFVQANPEFAPGLALLPSLAEDSKILQETTASYDPAISQLLAFGRALHPRHHRDDPKMVPVIAVPGGLAGQMVRVMQLVPETLGWDNENNVKLKNETFQSRVQGLWSGNGSRIQQLQFASSDREPTEWIAVRDSGAISVLRLILRETEMSQTHHVLHFPVTEDVEFRIELEHIVTLPARRSGGLPQADMCFNPWDPSEFAVVDQSSYWSVWRIQSINGTRGIWKLASGLSGQLDEPSSHGVRNPVNNERRYDGWGAIKWINNGAGLIVCNRRNVVCYELRDPPSQSPLAADLGLKKSNTWISCIQQSFENPDYLFVATTSRILWMHLALEYSKGKGRPQLSSKILLGWRHFRTEIDISLSMQVADFDTGVIVILHSRLTGLQTVFTLEHGKSSSKPASSVCDPYLFPATSAERSTSYKSLSFTLRALSYENNSDRSDHESHTGFQEDDNQYYRYVTLNDDLSLHELFLVVDSSTLRHLQNAPQSLSRRRARRSSHKVQEDFIVPDEIPDVNLQHFRRSKAPSLVIEPFLETLIEKNREAPAPDDPRTINLEWLTDYIDSSSGTRFDEALRLIPSQIFDRIEAAVSGVVSLEELLNQDTIVDDVEDDSVALEDLINTLEGRSLAGHDDTITFSEDAVSMSRLGVGLAPPGDSLSRTYDALIKSWISSLSVRVPDRVRTRTGRVIRSITAELQLADCGLTVQSKVDQHEERSQNVLQAGRATFTLPVRSVPDFSNESRQLKGKAVQRASGEAILSPSSDYRDYMPAASLPTPEPTPSVHSQVSSSTQIGIEDPAIGRLRSFASVAFQPQLPSAMMGILNQWSVGQNPDDYDWESSKVTIEKVDEHEEAEEGGRGKKRQRKNRFPREQLGTTATASWQPPPSRTTTSQVERPSDPQYSSQPTLVTGSQPQPGRFGSRRMVKKDKKPGFR